MDHLNGVLLIERLDDDQRKEAKKLLRQLRLQIAKNDSDRLNLLPGE